MFDSLGGHHGSVTPVEVYSPFKRDAAGSNPARPTNFPMTPLQRSVLVLNASYEAINVCTVQRAMVLICKGAAIVQEKSPYLLRTAKAKIPLPSVIRLLSYRHVPRRTRAVSRKNVMIRDGYACQYCLAVLPGKELTLDHVHPRSRGGKSTWENLVACCYGCNNRKGDRTPSEARMVLAKPPRPFGLHAKHRLMGAGEESWHKYLYF